MFDANSLVGFLESAGKAYRTLCRPICADMGLTETSFDILMHLGNFPSCKTESDITDAFRFTQNLSTAIDQLVKDGYLVRAVSEDDSSQIEFQCTDKAQSVIRQGREHQELFYDLLLDGFSDDDKSKLNTMLVLFNACLNQVKTKEELEKLLAEVEEIEAAEEAAAETEADAETEE